MIRAMASVGFVVSCAGVLFAPAMATAAVISIETVFVGDAGNAADPTPTEGQHFGAVEYEYRIGEFEVTNAQYAAFLSAKPLCAL